MCHQQESNGYCLLEWERFVFVNFSPRRRIVNSGHYIESLRSLNCCLYWVCPTSVCATEVIKIWMDIVVAFTLHFWPHTIKFCLAIWKTACKDTTMQMTVAAEEWEHHLLGKMCILFKSGRGLLMETEAVLKVMLPWAVLWSLVKCLHV